MVSWSLVLYSCGLSLFTLLCVLMVLVIWYCVLVVLVKWPCPQVHKTMRPYDHDTTWPQDHNTTGPWDHKTMLPHDHMTTRPCDRKTIWPLVHKYETMRPQDHRTTSLIPQEQEIIFSAYHTWLPCNHRRLTLSRLVRAWLTYRNWCTCVGNGMTDIQSSHIGPSR